MTGVNFGVQARAFEAAARYKAGEPVAFICGELGYSKDTVRMLGRKYFPDVKRPYVTGEHRVHNPRPFGGQAIVPSRISRPETRNSDMAVAYSAGLTLQQVANQHNVSRERVRQILRKMGVPVGAGGRTLRGKKREEKRVADINARCYAKNGISRDVWEAIGADGRNKFRWQRRAAEYRGIVWTLTLGEWWGVWQESGKWQQRGRTKSDYVMSRIDDKGGYVYGNVYITSASNNCREARRGPNAKRGERNGVYFMLPGYAKPWYAKFGKRSLGYYATEQEARAARERYLEQRA